MSVRLVFLGRLADLAGVSERDVPLMPGASLNWTGLINALDTQLAAEISGEKVKLALNGALLADKTSLAAHSGDELALLPPVSGG